MMSACSQNPKLKITILFDYFRGTRGTNNSVTLLRPLLQKYPDQVKMFLFHSDLLHGLMKKILPSRINEIVGVHHCKLYFVDDRVLCSGANLSDTYFLNRQDRYVWVSHTPPLLNYLRTFVDILTSVSFQVSPGGDLTPMGPHPEDTQTFQSFLRLKLSQLLKTPPSHWDPEGLSGELSCEYSDTWVIPTCQLGSCGIRHDEHIVRRFLELTNQKGAHWALSSPYLNLTPHYRRQLLEAQSTVDIITASPQANSFFTAKDISQVIPKAYSWVEEQLFSEISSRNLENRIRLREFARPEWTFHGKGLWYYPVGKSLPSATLIGSGNLGLRSAERDSEAQLFLVTENATLQQLIDEERLRVWEGSVPVTPETFHPSYRRPSWLTRQLLPWLQHFL